MSLAKERVEKLRQLMKQKHIDAWIAPSADAHQSEYVADHWRARAWLSGFTGSAGTVVVTMDRAGLWTDSRYFIQAEQELQGSGIDLFKMGTDGTPSYTKWLSDNLDNEAIVGFDGSLLSVAEVDQLIEDLAEKQISLSYNEDLIDKIWDDRPTIPTAEIFQLDETITGESRTVKIERIRDKMNDYQADCHLITTLDDIAWTFNIRGNDIAYNPVAVAFAFITSQEVFLFINDQKVPDGLRNAFENEKIQLLAYNKIYEFLRKLKEDRKIVVDFNKISQKIKDAIPNGCQLIKKINIPTELKTIKNETEIKGFKDAHVRDGVAMVKWLHWLENNLGKIPMDEVSVADRLESFRSENDKFRGLSFSTIVGYKENGAIVHYTAKKETAAVLEPEGLLLVDSGAQYLDGTTDITRTISLGKPTTEEKEAFTAVLKGHINLSKAIFPKEYTGAMIDTFSRAALWEKFYNYGHGTGHGIGHFLNVHEGPQQIRPTNHYEIKIGMVHSNEPGMYLKGKFGIRIENLMVTVQKQENEYGTFLGFDILTLCPIDLSLINPDILDNNEIVWLNNYHARVYDSLAPYLNDSEKVWLEKKTQEI
ncbi:MAG: aminopeptidase P family protein [Fidelibacterota bacterium]